MTVARSGKSTENSPSPRWFTRFCFCAFVDFFFLDTNVRLQTGFRFLAVVVRRWDDDEDVRFTGRDDVMLNVTCMRVNKCARCCTFAPFIDFPRAKRGAVGSTVLTFLNQSSFSCIRV